MSSWIFALIIVITGAVGGALSGARIGGKDVGHSLAAMMGVCFGLSATVPAALVALAWLLFKQHGS